LIYNEILNYRVFEEYISKWIEKRSIVLEKQVDEKDVKRFLSKSLDIQ
jgi:hypothetical protein